MALTGKQKRLLKARGQTMKDDLQIGKAGLSASLLTRLKELLSKKELVKLRFTDAEGAERDELAEEVAGKVGAECVHILGRTMLLYKPNAELDAKKRLLQ